MSWASPLVTFHCGACGTTVTGLLGPSFAIQVEQAHAKVCKGFAPSDHEVAGDGNAAGTPAAAQSPVSRPENSPGSGQDGRSGRGEVPRAVFRFKLNGSRWNWPVEGSDTIVAFRELLALARIKDVKVDA